jgi:hypothetical protein
LLWTSCLTEGGRDLFPEECPPILSVGGSRIIYPIVAKCLSGAGSVCADIVAQGSAVVDEVMDTAADDGDNFASLAVRVTTDALLGVVLVGRRP